MAESMRLRAVTYNIHRARGLDGWSRVDRIVDVLKEVDADIVALQEVLAAQGPVLAAATSMHVVFGETRVGAQGPYGNLCLSRFPLVAHETYSLTCRPFEPRGCLRADIDHGAGHLHIFNVHLGLRYRERIRQVRMLSRILDRGTLAGPRLLLGDFNEWFNGRASRLLRDEFGHPSGRMPRAPTHPSVFPVFPLDRIYHDPAVRVERVAVHRSRLARVASDHLPTFADLRLESPR
ncbi:MAG: endonuclease/exonuclease/phosphatase family protein [Candidatus Rokuibacteriota bacterium]